MNIMIVGDLHFGVRQDDPKIMKIIEDFFDRSIEYSKRNKIDTWIQVGDWFDVRKAITHTTMEFCSKVIIPKIEAAGIKIYVLIGNHDMKFRNKIQPNAVEELLSQYEFIKVIDTPTTVNFDGLDIDLFPWMCEENISDILEFIKNTKSEYSLGHWELSGFKLSANSSDDRLSEGFSPSFLSKYERVWSGHYHSVSESGNIQYIGTPYTLTFGDANEDRGFWIFNTSTKKDTFVKMPKCWHRRINYPEARIFLDINDLSDCFVQMTITEEDDELIEYEKQLGQIVHYLQSTRSKQLLQTGVEETIDNIILSDGTEIALNELNSSDGELVDGDSGQGFNLSRIFDLYIENSNHEDKDKKKIKKIITSLLSQSKENRE